MGLSPFLFLHQRSRSAILLEWTRVTRQRKVRQLMVTKIVMILTILSCSSCFLVNASMSGDGSIFIWKLRWWIPQHPDEA
jgi:hypothetical protein